MITGLYAAILGLMLVVLILRVARRRLKYKVGLGDGGISDLGQAIRVHGNFVETVPILLILLLVMEENVFPAWGLHIFGTGIVISRLFHAYGITMSPLASAGRKYGTFLAIFLIIAGSLALILSFLSNLIT